ncbi:winged helix-turn-helix transcriptional regulator [Scytonema sp. UIC 10036]|uniref:Lrp/AsnC family transcriptional regulator n=1 Tax=Scytonema sp. UIC 10036 TaxID=2304196 RepID=UPI0012DA6FED|nr:Lrp/AsnC family transcriptional regulator [Scytonema sp. UIC 10036]MUG92903.1 winged helix-turn-helix transcriptional regulator [Scytonema sp. UIC 10036]
MTFELEKLLDDTGWQILSILQQEARISFKELGQRVGLSSPAVAERVRKMEEAGIITRYRAELNLEKLGLTLTAFIQINSVGKECVEITTLAKQLPEVLECYRVTGSVRYIMKVAVSSIKHLETLMDRLVPHGTVTTSVVLSAPVNRRSIEQELANPVAPSEYLY